MSDEPRTFDLRLWVTAPDAWPAALRFRDDAAELAERFHPGIEVRWVAEQRRRPRRRPRVQPPSPPEIDDAGDARQEGRTTT